MKSNGCTFECEEERNRDLMRAYHEDINSCDNINLSEVWIRIAEMPSARFWVSEERAAIVVSRMIKGDNLHYMRPTKREMFREIYQRVMELRKENPQMSVFTCCIKVVNMPAPKFYMTPLSIRQTIYKIKRAWYKERKQKLRHLF